MAAIKCPNQLLAYSVKQEGKKKVIVRTHDLNGTEYMVYLYLLKCCSHGRNCVVKYKTISRKLGIRSHDTIRHTIAALSRKGLVASKKLFRFGQLLCCVYRASALPGPFFFVDEAIFTVIRDKAQFAVYLSLLMHSDKHGEAFPSAYDIHCETGLSETTIRKAITGLVLRGLITRQRRINKCGDYTKNLYRIIPLKLWKKRHYRIRRKAPKSLAVFLHRQLVGMVRKISFFLSKGWVNFRWAIIRPIQELIKEKRKE